VRDSRLSVVDEFTVDSPKTKLLSQKLKDMGLKEVMLITDKIDENLYLSSRNLPNVMVVEVGHADPVSLLRYDKILMTQSAVTKIEEMLS
jgi:large subunit ribosomal protein L4